MTFSSVIVFPGPKEICTFWDLRWVYKPYSSSELLAILEFLGSVHNLNQKDGRILFVPEKLSLSSRTAKESLYEIILKINREKNFGMRNLGPESGNWGCGSMCFREVCWHLLFVQQENSKEKGKTGKILTGILMMAVPFLSSCQALF